VEGRLGQESEGLLAGYRPGEFPAQQFVDDETGVVRGDVQVPEDGHEGGDVDRAVAVGEDVVDRAPVLVGGDAVDPGVEVRLQTRAGVVYQCDDGLAFADPVAFGPDALGCDVHTVSTVGPVYNFGKAFITPGD
jgi:hypothetical protein